MTDGPIRVRIPLASWTLEFRPRVLDAFRGYAQLRWWRAESVGQLFTSDLTRDVVGVDEVTRLASICSSPRGVKFDPQAAEAERTHMFSRGLHCIGLWHTHPEPMPRPSSSDLELAADHAYAAQPTLTGLVFVIVGTAPWPAGLGVWVHDGNTAWATALEQNATSLIVAS